MASKIILVPCGWCQRSMQTSEIMRHFRNCPSRPKDNFRTRREWNFVKMQVLDAFEKMGDIIDYTKMRFKAPPALWVDLYEAWDELGEVIYSQVKREMLVNPEERVPVTPEMFEKLPERGPLTRAELGERKAQRLRNEIERTSVAQTPTQTPIVSCFLRQHD
jgi:hypothetical protein